MSNRRPPSGLPARGTPQAMIHPKYRPDIDGLRAVAVLLVVGYHLFPEWVPGGYIGVDVFFVISGFLISTILFENLAAGRFSLGDFYGRRVRRIFPALLVVLITLLILGWCFFIPEDYEKLGKHTFAGAAFVSNLVSLSEYSYFDDAAEFKPLLHLWSLGIEEQFYIVWPVVLWFGWKLRLSIPLLLAALILVSFGLNIFKTDVDTTFAFFALRTRAWELLAGAAIGYAALSWRARRDPTPAPDKSLLSFCGLVAIALGCLSLTRHSQFPGWWALLPVAGAALILSAGPASWINREILAHRALVAVGLFSYPLYLWHWALLSFVCIALNPQPSVGLRAQILLLSFALAWLTYRFVETPLRRVRHPGSLIAALSLLMLTVAAFGLYIYREHGRIGQTALPALAATPASVDCRAEFAANRLCEIGNPAAKETILLYGDSHADHLSAALKQALGARYRILFGYYPSCFFGTGIARESAIPATCAALIDQIRQLKGQKLKAAIWAQRWHGYGVTGRDTITAAVGGAIKAYGLEPEKVIIVGSTADIDLRCAKWNYYFGETRWKRNCIVPAGPKAANEEFMRVTRDLPVRDGVHFVYPFSRLCDQTGCKIIENGVSYYSDTHHLTRDGAALIMPEIKSILQDYPLQTGSDVESPRPSP